MFCALLGCLNITLLCLVFSFLLCSISYLVFIRCVLFIFVFGWCLSFLCAFFMKIKHFFRPLFQNGLFAVNFVGFWKNKNYIGVCFFIGFCYFIFSNIMVAKTTFGCQWLLWLSEVTLGCFWLLCIILVLFYCFYSYISAVLPYKWVSSLFFIYLLICQWCCFFVWYFTFLFCVLSLVASGCFGCRRWLLVAFGFSRLLTLSLVVNIYLFFARVFVCFDFVLFFTKPVFCCYYFIFSILLFVVELLFVWFGLLFFIFKVIVYLAILFWFRKLVFVFLLFLLLLDVVLCFY